MLEANSDESALSCSVLPFLSVQLWKPASTAAGSFLGSLKFRKKDCICISFFITGHRMSRVGNVQYKLPLFNPLNVQKYKLFGVLKRLVPLKSKIVFFYLPLLLMLLQTLMIFLNVNLNFDLVLTQSYCMALKDLKYRSQVIWNTFIICSWYLFLKC